MRKPRRVRRVTASSQMTSGTEFLKILVQNLQRPTSQKTGNNTWVELLL